MTPQATSPAVTALTAWPIRRGTVRLNWVLAPGNWLALKIQRDPGDGTFTTIGKVTGAEQFLDNKAPTDTINRTIRYRLLVDGLEDIYGPIKLGVAEPDIIAERARGDHELLLEGWGVPVTWFSIKTTPATCSCYSTLLQQSTQSDCPDCGGTGLGKGYALPLIDYVFPVAAENKQSVVLETGAKEQHMQGFWSSGDVLAKPNDVFVMPTSERYRVIQVLQSRVRGFPVKQTMQCITINPGDIEFDFEIPDALLEVMRNPPNRTHMYLG